MKTLTDKITVFFWMASLVAFVTLWVMRTHLMGVDIALPFVMLVLSLVVFRNAPFHFRWVHHVPVIAALVTASVGVGWLVFFGREQSAVGAYFLVYMIGLGYSAFILLFLVALAIHKILSKWSKKADAAEAKSPMAD